MSDQLAARLRPAVGPFLITLVVAVAIMAAGVAVKALGNELLQANLGFVIYIPAIALAAWYRGFLGGVIATLFGALADSLVFTPPLVILTIDVGDHELRLLAYVLGGVAVSYLAHRLRSERDRARLEAAEHQQALDEAARTREEVTRLVESERRAAELRDAFNGIISHELRTPITAIYGGAKLLARRDRQLDQATREELIDDLEAEADRLYRLVEDLLVLSRSERGSVERASDPVVVERVVERVVASEQPRWPAVHFSVQSSAQSTARGDDTYVEQVARNLLSNAAKYSPAGSTVTIVVDETDEGVRVRVLDEGVGIDPAESARLFELYYRSPATAGITGGAGIGLFVCRALVEAMGGRIWAARRDGVGSEFGFVLARQSEDETSD